LRSVSGPSPAGPEIAFIAAHSESSTADLTLAWLLTGRGDPAVEGDGKRIQRRLREPCGDLRLARLPEPYALIWIHLALRRRIGTNFAFGLLRSKG
jgi:hypothetical protein